MEKPNRLQSPQRRVRGLGSAKSGVSHWWWERVTALALVPLCLWFVCSLMSAMLFPSAADVSVWLASPVSALLMALLILLGFWHAALGNQVVIEDYVHAPTMKFSLIILNNLLCLVLAAACLLAVLKLHLFGSPV